MLLEFLVGLVTALALVILGLFTFLKNRKSATNILFAFLTFVLAEWTYVNYFSLHSDSEVVTLYWIRVVMFITSFMGPVLFLLLHTFPRDKLTLAKKYLILISITTVASALLAMSPYMFVSVSIANGVQPTPGPAILVFAINFFGSVIAGFITVIRKYRKAKGLEKLQLKYLFLGLVITFTLFTITNFIFVVLLRLSSFVIFGPLFNLILVSFVTYAIVKHRLMDIRLVVARTVSYVLLLTVLASVYVFSLYAVSNIFYGGVLGTTQLYFNSLLALIIAFTLQPLRHFLEHTTDKIFFKDRYNTEALLTSLTRIMSSSLILKSLISNSLEKLLNRAKISKGVFVLWEYNTIKEIYSNSDDKFQDFTKENIELLINSSTQPVIFDELQEGRRKEALRKIGFYFGQRLQVKDQVIGLLLLGEKLSGDIYSDQDIELLTILSPQLTVAIENALAYQKIQKFSETLKLEVDHATEELRHTNEKLRQVSALKDEFVSLTSHELRTPLTAIAGSISTVLEGYAGKIDKKTKEFLDGAYNENLRLIRLVNNLLNISRIESGRLKFNFSDFELGPIMDEISENLQSELIGKKITYSYQYEPKILITADQDKVREILINIVGNALKYTDQGKVFLTAATQDGHVLISVEDTGHGIHPEDQLKLFKKFERVDGLGTGKAKGGTGLGLYICKTLLGGMGGEIWLKSEYGKGTTFYFILPLKLAKS